MNELNLNDQTFENFIKEKQLKAVKCMSCGTFSVPLRPVCPNCHGTAMTLSDMTGKGKLKTFTIITVVPPNMAALGYGRNHPYITGVVELEEGCRVVARIQGLDIENPEKIPLDMDMKADFINEGDGEYQRSILAFSPV